MRICVIFNVEIASDWSEQERRLEREDRERRAGKTQKVASWIQNGKFSKFHEEKIRIIVQRVVFILRNRPHMRLKVTKHIIFSKTFAQGKKRGRGNSDDEAMSIDSDAVVKKRRR